MKEYTHLLIDGRNILYRALFAELKYLRPGDYAREPKNGSIFKAFLKFIREYQKKFSPKQIHIFWDDKGSNLWRRKKYADYKINRKNRADGVPELLNKYYNLSLIVFENMGIKQYLKDGQEADDLIYSFCKATDEPCCLLSSDSDLKQIRQRMPNIDIYSPMAKDGYEPVGIPEYDIAVQKALMGDSSDNIAGYAGVGEKRSSALVKDPRAMEEFLNSDKAIIIDNNNNKIKVGKTLFESNLELVDLEKCPYLNENIEYVKWVQSRNVIYNHSELLRVLRKYKMDSVLEDVHIICVPFANLTIGKSHGK